MTTKNPRINVTFEEEILQALTILAKKHNNKPIASLVRDLTIEALELHEDLALSKLATRLDKNNTKLYSHQDAWK